MFGLYCFYRFFTLLIPWVLHEIRVNLYLVDGNCQPVTLRCRYLGTVDVRAIVHVSKLIILCGCGAGDVPCFLFVGENLLKNLPPADVVETASFHSQLVRTLITYHPSERSLVGWYATDVAPRLLKRGQSATLANLVQVREALCTKRLVVLEIGLNIV